MFSRILLGIDFGPASLAAARWATTHVAPRSEAIVAHVAPHPDAPSPERSHALEDGDATQRAPALAGGLAGFAATLEVATVHNILRFGSPSHWLSALADDAEASLLVLGRRAQANRIRLGEPNVIERAARRTGASVLVVPEGTVQGPGCVIAAVDDSAFAPPVLRAARRLARFHAIPMAVLHVLSPAVGAYERVIRTARHVLTSTRSPAAPVLPASLPERTSWWLSSLARANDDEAGDDGDRVEVTLGDPAREIALTATAAPAPLIVIGMRGADLAPRGSLGSVARELLTRAPVPVLAIQPG